MIETQFTFETPEGVELHLNIAGPVVRCYAFLWDLLLRLGIQIVLWIILGLLGKIGVAVSLILFFGLEWFYPVLFEVLRYGQTPGKKMMGIRVVHDNGTPVGWGASTIRNLLRAVDFLPFLYILGVFSMMINGRFQRLGDMVSGTLVTYEESQPAESFIPKESPKTFPMPISLEEQQAIIALAERSLGLSRDRVKELANILSKVVGKKDDEAVKELFKVTNGLMGLK